MEKTKIENVAMVLTPQQVHKSVRNYIINELDVSKSKIDEMVRQLVENRVDIILRDQILDSKWFYNIIERTVMSIMKEGVSSNTWYDKNEPFKKYIERIIANTIQDLVIDSYDISINEKEIKK